MIIEPPNLETLDTPPSWVNRAGRVDRSACLEVTAKEVARRAYDLPAGRVVRRGKEASFVVTLTAYEVARLHESRPPRRLIGDFRTGKSNAMRPAPGSAEDVARQKKLRRRVRASWSPPPPPESGEGGELLDVGLPGNPNAGAGCGKVSGLDEGWRQSLRVERWRWNRLAVQHFLICPRCRRKKVKLFLPLATAGEVRDARIAAAWLRGLRSGPGTAAEARVVERYGLLLERRELRCAACWGVRYGEVKKGGRRGDSVSGAGTARLAT